MCQIIVCNMHSCIRILCYNSILRQRSDVSQWLFHSHFVPETIYSIFICIQSVVVGCWARKACRSKCVVFGFLSLIVCMFCICSLFNKHAEYKDSFTELNLLEKYVVLECGVCQIIWLKLDDYFDQKKVWCFQKSICNVIFFISSYDETNIPIQNHNCLNNDLIKLALRKARSCNW